MTPAYLLALTGIVLLANFATATPVGKRVLDILGTREPQIDGLRGISAAVVALAHTTYFFYYKETGRWEMAPDSHFCVTAARSGVALFFLICAYIFWGRIARLKISVRQYDWHDLYRNRLLRLAPMYVVAMTVAIFLVGFVDQGFRLNEPIGAILKETLETYSFGFHYPWQFNGSFIGYAAIGVSWSLAWEWGFYFALPLIALSQIRRYWIVGLPLMLMVVELFANYSRFGGNFHWVQYFLYGAIVYELSCLPPVRTVMRSPVFSFLSVVAIIATTWFSTPDMVEHGIPPLLLSAGFLPIAAGNDWLGILSSRGARFIGAVSYSLYLVNIIVVMQILPLLPARPLGAPVYEQSGILLAIMGVLIGISTVTFLTIEVPWQQKKKAARHPIDPPETGMLRPAAAE